MNDYVPSQTDVILDMGITFVSILVDKWHPEIPVSPLLSAVSLTIKVWDEALFDKKKVNRSISEMR